MKRNFLVVLAMVAAFLGATPPVFAQWVTQSILIKPGWTAIYLHVDPSYQSLDQLVGSDPANPIVEIWRWQAPASTLQFVTSPQAPLTTGSDWAYWSRTNASAALTLATLTPNSAYLVHSTATNNYVWNIKGRPVAPNYTWTTTGLNFIGFPTPPNNPPPFDTFLAPVPAFAAAAQIYQYPGGPLGPANPALVIAPHVVHVNRGQAFWIRSGSGFNDYFGPFQVSLGGSGGINFGDLGSQYSFHLKNTSATNVTVTVRLVPSETPPAGQPALAGVPVILVRGALNTTNLTYGYTDLSTATASWTLPPEGQPGSDITVVLGVNRSAMTGAQDVLYGGILRFTDSYGFEQVDVPVSAQSTSTAGLWVGQAQVTQVANYLKSYERGTVYEPQTSGSNVVVVVETNQLLTDPNGSYIVTNVDTSLGAVAQPFPLRLILHTDGTNVVLLQRVYYGMDMSSNLVVATSQSDLDPAHLDSARRISCVTLPWTSANTDWPFSGGPLAPGNTLTAQVNLPYDAQQSNPFLHAYQPDHDNLDTTFQHELPPGVESYDINRTITLAIAPVGDDFDSLTQAGQTFSGNYSEGITLVGLNNASRTFNVAGTFTITRISPIATLTQP